MVGVELVFLLGLGFMWILFATISDIKTREIPNWLNFSLIAFALGFRFFYSLFNLSDFSLFLQGLIGLAIFFILGNLFYYGRMFAGGDKKLMIALGAVLPVFPTFSENMNLFLVFFLFFFFAGAIYGIFGSIFIALKNFKVFKKGFKKLFNENKKILILSVSLGIILILLSFYIPSFLYLSIFSFVFPYFYIFIKTVDNFCMVKVVPYSKITPGDWLYEDVRVKGRTIRATWDGLSQEEIKLLKGKSKVKLRYGIVFAPVFFISFLAFVVFLITGLFEKFLAYLF
ncbi:MAG: prepilin peptidase [Nanoarchaeota archaeon]|nr:prepilin peptidase [Nanoarchaeota archaeon]